MKRAIHSYITSVAFIETKTCARGASCFATNAELVNSTHFSVSQWSLSLSCCAPCIPADTASCDVRLMKHISAY